MLPFDMLQARRNQEYYSSRGLHLYRDFKTFGSCVKLAEANAIEFYAHVQKAWPGESELRVYEIGIGNGNFALNFLKKLERLDRAFARRVVYFLGDMAETLLQNAQKRLGKFQVETVCMPAEALLVRKAHHIRSMELLDDLPAKIFVRDRVSEKTYEVLFSADQKEWKPRPCRNPQILQEMETMPAGYWIPVSTAAVRCLTRWSRGLVKRGYVDIFDYGFQSVEDIVSLPPEMWNAHVVRPFHSQLTCDVNFAWLRNRIPSLRVEPQKAYVERIGKEALHYVELDQLEYLTERELRTRSRELTKHGYPSGFFRYAEEREEYWHARVERECD